MKKDQVCKAEYLKDEPDFLCLWSCIFWLRNGSLHRDTGAASIESNGFRRWYRNNLLHRDNGPAVIRADGSIGWYRKGRVCKKVRSQEGT